VVAILELLIDLHRPFDRGRSQDLFMRIGHVAIRRSPASLFP
jgi:hypothetical protein